MKDSQFAGLKLRFDMINLFVKYCSAVTWPQKVLEIVPSVKSVPWLMAIYNPVKKHLLLQEVDC